MSQADDDLSQFYLTSWNSELGRREKEAILKDGTQHPHLTNLWEAQFNTPTWLNPDAIDHLLLIDTIGQGCMSYVCRGVTADGQTRCVKFPNYDAHAPDSWSVLERSIVNEAQILKRLTDVDTDVGTLPRWIADGQIRLEGRLCPYVVTEYLFDLKPLDHLEGSAFNEQLKFWIAASELLECLHKRHIVHADLHGSNLLIDARGKPVLLDFGNAQTRDRWLPGRRVERRFFGPLVALHVDEVLSPHRPLTCAFDVMCLSQLIRAYSHAHLSPHLERALDLLPERCDGPGFYDQMARLSRLVCICTEPEPEYRLPNAMALTAALRTVATGPATVSQRNWKSSFQVLFRKHALLMTTVSASIVLMLSLLAIVGLRLRQERLVSQYLAEKIEQNATALKRLRASNAAALESMRELLQGAVERDRLLEVVSSSGRDQLAQRLVEMLEGDILEEDSEIVALDLALQLSAAAIELDGVEQAWSVTSRCRELIDRIYERSGPHRPELALVEVQTDAIISRILYERKGRSDEDRDRATERSSRAAQRYLALPLEQYRTPVLRKAYLNTALQLSTNGLYLQRAEACFKADHGELLYQVLHAALASASQPDSSIVRELCGLHRMLGLAMHKSVFFNSPHYPADTDFGVRCIEQYEQALKVLECYGSDARAISARDTRQIEASIKSVLGMSLTNQLRHAEALVALHEAYLLRQRAAQEFPGSLARQREYINTGWNYADAFRNQWLDGASRDLITKAQASEIDVRTNIVNQCREVLQRDWNGESEGDFLVNAVRLATTRFFIDQVEAAEAILDEVTATLPEKHLRDLKLGLDGLLALAILSRRPEVASREAWDMLLRDYLQFLQTITTRVTAEQEVVQRHRVQQFVTAIESVMHDHLQSHADWLRFKQLYGER